MFISDHQQKRPLEHDQGMEANKRTRTSDESVEVGMLFQHQDLGPVIGKGGEKIESIREQSGAQVHTSKFVPGVAERTARIMGSAEEVSSAIKMIIETGSKDQPTIILLAEYMNCGLLIGKQGATIKQIRDETHAEIQVSSDCIGNSTQKQILISSDCIGNSTQKQILISGDYESVIKAIDAVVVHLAEGRNPTRMAYIPGGMAGIPNTTKRFANVNSPEAGRGWTLPPSRGFPISPAARGGGFHQQRFGGGGGDFGAMGGRSQGMGAFPNGGNRRAGGGGGALQIRTEMTLWITKDLIGKIIGRGGLTVKAIREQSTAHVYIHKDEEDTESTERRITIKGSKQTIDMAYSMIETLVAGG